MPSKTNLKLVGTNTDNQFEIMAYAASYHELCCDEEVDRTAEISAQVLQHYVAEGELSCSELMGFIGMAIDCADDISPDTAKGIRKALRRLRVQLTKATGFHGTPRLPDNAPDDARWLAASSVVTGDNRPCNQHLSQP